MKNSTKLLIGFGIFAAATTAITIGVVRELKAIRNLTIDVDNLPDEDEAMEELTEELEAEEAVEAAEEAVEEAAEEVAEEPVAEETTDEAVAD